MLPNQPKLCPISPHQSLARSQTLTVRLEPEGLEFEANSDLTVLEAALLSDVDLPSSCRNGTCRTCVCTLLSGQITYKIDWPGLSLEEKQAGLILTCVAFPQSDLRLKIGY